MKATFVIADAVMARLRVESSRTGKSMSALVELALIKTLANPSTGPDVGADPDGLEALHHAMASS
ncbi:MAG: hypothetical protein AB2A00_36375 [Myxococcota bacterium]